MVKDNTQKANQTSSAAHNRRLAVRLLREHGELSRRQLAQITGLRSSTLTYIVRELLENRIVRTVGKRQSNTVGKKQMLLEINPDLGWVAGAGIDRDTMSISFLNAAGKVIGRERFNSGHDVEELPGKLAAHIRDWALREGESMENLLGAGIGIPGVVDSERGVLMRSTWLKAHAFPFAALLGEQLDAPVLIDNDANFAAIAESHLGSARGLSNFIYFFVSSQRNGDLIEIYGLGSTYFLNYKLYRGTHFGAGEVDAVLESNRIERVTPGQLELMADEQGTLTPELEKIATSLATTMASVGNLLDPQAIVLGGNVSITNHQMVQAIERAMNRMLVPLPNRFVHVRPSRFLDHGISMGAATAAIEAVNIVEEVPTMSPRVMSLSPKAGGGNGASRGRSVRDGLTTGRL